MRVIYKEISVEDFTSRLPSVLPAYLDNELYFFDDKSLREREYLYPSNYGMVPVNIVLNVSELSGHTSYSFVNGCHCYDKSMDKDGVENHFDSFCNNFTISFYTLSKWYHEFEDYYALLNQHSHCDLIYENAEDYYNHESGLRYRDQIMYGTDKQTYIDLDERIRSMGGHPEFDEERNETVDKGFYKWICENIVPSFTIPFTYQEYWKTRKLYYPDVVHWLGWFEERVMKYEKDGMTLYSGATSASPETWDCRKDGIDCCDCDEYFSRGGKRTYEPMKDWYDALQEGIRNMNSTISGNENCFIPTMILPCSIQTSIDDMGQFSIFSKEYENGVDYRVASGYGASENTVTGTVVTHDGKPMILSDGNGFCFDENLMEMLYNDNDWSDYTEKFIRENPDMFVTSGYSHYTYDEDGLIVTGTSSGNCITNLEKKYDIIAGNYVICEDGVMTPIEKTEYGTVWNKVTGEKTEYFVYRDEHTDTPYTVIDGKTIYGELHYNWGTNNPPFFYFSQFKSENYSASTYSGTCSGVTDNLDMDRYKHFARRFNENDTKEYFTYDGLIYDLNGSGDTFYIDNVRFNVITGYSIDESGNYMYCFKDGKVYDLSVRTFFEVENSSINGNQIIISVATTPPIYNVREVTGTTVSKVYGLRLTNLLVDDIGNTIEGWYDPKAVGAKYHQPKEGTEIEPIYQVGNTANIVPIDLSGDTNTGYFVGDIITEMSFYYKDLQGNIFERGKGTVTMDGNGNTRLNNGSANLSYKSLSAITYATNAKNMQEQAQSGNTYEGDYWFFDEDIYCDITYYTGATLKRMVSGDNGSTPFILAYSPGATANNYNYGVEYKETVRFVKTRTEYYLKKKPKKFLPINREKAASHTVSYPIFTYVLTQETTDMDNTTYGTVWSVPLATFKAEINLVNSNLETTFGRYSDMDSYNGIQAYPIFKEEYLMGVSSLENVDANIYIERGINAAFEKHLKLGEVKSLDDLLQYGNGYYKIMED